MEAARGLARLRLANLTHVHTFRRGESACSLRQREKSYYYDAREAHYNRFGPHAWFDPNSLCTSRYSYILRCCARRGKKNYKTFYQAGGAAGLPCRLNAV